MAVEESTDYVKLINTLEQQEIESPGGIATPQVYGQLLAAYLLQNDLPNSKYLWKRIPAAVKTANPELGNIWSVGQKIWLRDFPGVYESLKKEWSESIQPLMTALADSTRKRALLLVSQAYSSICIEDFSAFVGVPASDAAKIAIEEGWQADSQSKMIMPKKPVPTVSTIIPGEQQLARLTEFVAFLEN
ncbi:COP9 signalosome complex subunit 8-like [Lineus longissimus]|uniref:COP9 signalosome complex subunit 8-like n=1 Tax=Lineus longissimus TaxID=88925 RepID=UPI002B4E5A07